MASADRRALVLLLVSSGAYVVLRVLAFQRGVASGGDTQSYKEAADLPFFSLRFLAGTRALFFPLVWKILGNTEAVVVFQLVASIVGWLVLAWGVASVVRHWVVKLVAVWLAFGLSLSTPVTEWDHYLLSDSLSLSMLALLVGVALLTIGRPSWIGMAVAIAVAFAWTATRDTNAYAGVVVAPAFLVAYLLRRRAILAAALGATVLLAATSFLDAQHGRRADQPIRDTIWLRLQADNHPAFEWIYLRWDGLHGAKTPGLYRSYLLHHPVYTLARPLESGKTAALFSSSDRLTALYTPQVGGYDSETVRGAKPHFYRWRIPTVVQNLFWPRHPGSLGIELLVVSLLALTALALGVGRDWRLAVAFVVLLAVYPQAVVTWHVSGQEIDRHALTAATELRIAMLLALVVSIDALASSALTARAKRT